MSTSRGPRDSNRGPLRASTDGTGRSHGEKHNGSSDVGATTGRTEDTYLRDLLEECDEELAIASEYPVCRDEVDELLDFRLMIMEATTPSRSTG